MIMMHKKMTDVDFKFEGGITMGIDSRITTYDNVYSVIDL